MNKNVMVCFPPGSGGHFVYSICTLLFDPEIKNYKTSKNGSMHNNGLFNKFFIDLTKYGLVLEHNNYEEEKKFIESSSEVFQSDEPILGHIRQIGVLSKIKKVVYITFEEDDKDTIYDRIYTKALTDQVRAMQVFTKEAADKYLLWKSKCDVNDTWPTWDEFRAGNIPEDLIMHPSKTDRPLLNDWYYVLPDVKENICEITFKQILNGNEMLEKLVDFLQIKQYNKDKLNQFINDYRTKNKELYK